MKNMVRFAPLLVAALLVMSPASAQAAPTAKSPQHPPGHRPASIDIRSYGATANDASDDQPAIQRAVDAAKQQHRSVYVPPGTFLYGDLITLDGVRLSGAGPQSVLRATSVSNQAVVLQGRGAAVADLRLTTVSLDTRLSTDTSARVFVTPQARDFNVRGVTIDGAASAGVICFGRRGAIVGNRVSDTLADGIHITGTSQSILVSGNQVENVGDDEISVVSYEKNDRWVKDVLIVGNTVAGGKARGITVSGGENVAVESNRVSDTGGAGIYLASEGSYRTYAVKNVHVAFNTVTRDSQNPAVPERGGIRVQATNAEPSIDGALIERNTFRDSGDSGVLIVGASSVRARFSRNLIEHPAGYGIRIVSSVTGTLDFTRNTVNDSGSAPFSNASSARVRSDQPNDPNAGSGTDGKTATAAQGTPVIDGTVDPLWSDATVMQLNTDPDGTTGTAQVAWDAQNLYFLFQMHDDTPATAGKNENNDSVEVWVDELHMRNGTRTTGDYQLRVDRAGALSSVVDGFDFSGVRRAVVDRPDGYTVEIAVPYRNLTPAIGDVIGFNASANDDANDDGVRDTYISWVDRDLPYYADTRDYGTVTLAAPH